MNYTELINRIEELKSRKGRGSISADETFSLLMELAEKTKAVDINAGSLTVRRLYTSVAAMNADQNPMDQETGKPLKFGQLACVCNSNDLTQADNGKIYRYNKPGWEFLRQVGDMVQFAKKVEVDNKLSQVETEVKTHSTTYKNFDIQMAFDGSRILVEPQTNSTGVSVRKFHDSIEEIKLFGASRDKVYKLWFLAYASGMSNDRIIISESADGIAWVIWIDTGSIVFDKKTNSPTLVTYNASGKGFEMKINYNNLNEGHVYKPWSYSEIDYKSDTGQNKTGLVISASCYIYPLKQQKGNSPDTAMSQKAVTDIFHAIDESAETEVVMDCTIVNDKYCTKWNTILDSAAWAYGYTDVKEGDRFILSSNIGANSNVVGVLFRNEREELVSCLLNGGSTVQNIRDYEFGIPSGATKMYLTHLKNELFELKAKTVSYISRAELDQTYIRKTEGTNRLNVRLDGTRLEVSAGYGNESLTLVFSKFGSNNLFDLSSVTAGERILLTPSTDFFTAYKVNAVNNIDGTGGRTDENTGGNHAFNTTSGSATAINNYVKILIDEVERNTFKGSCSVVDILINNDVQANNTARSDGSGRAVLNETNRIVLTKERTLKLCLTRTIRAKEDIVFSRLFLNSMMINRYGKFRFLTSTKTSLYDVKSGLETSSELNNGSFGLSPYGDVVRTEIDTISGYGAYRIATDKSQLCYQNSLKLYNAVVNKPDGLIMGQGDMIEIYGKTEFYKQ